MERTGSIGIHRGAAGMLALAFVAVAVVVWPGDGHPAGTPPELQAAPAGAWGDRVRDVSLLGEVRIAPGGTVLGTPLGGLSGIAYDPDRDAYLAISDDRSERAAARMYELEIDVADGSLADGDVRFTAVITLTDLSGEVFAEGALDPEGIALAPGGSLYVSSEGAAAANPPIPPWVAEFDRGGRMLRMLPLPAHYLPASDFGIRNNLAFEPLAVTPGGSRLLTGVENALVQDGPASSPDRTSPSRLLQWDLAPGMAVREHVYEVAAWPVLPDPAGAYADNGLVELVALDEGDTMVALERSYAVGVGNTVRLYEISTIGATNVITADSLAVLADGEDAGYVPVGKRLIGDIASLGVRPDNLEGMTWGPELADGRRALVLVSDDNFNPTQVTQFVALAVEVADAVPSAAFLPVARRGD